MDFLSDKQKRDKDIDETLGYHSVFIICSDLFGVPPQQVYDHFVKQRGKDCFTNDELNIAIGMVFVVNGSEVGLCNFYSYEQTDNLLKLDECIRKWNESVQVFDKETQIWNTILMKLFYFADYASTLKQRVGVVKQIKASCGIAETPEQVQNAFRKCLEVISECHPRIS